MRQKFISLIGFTIATGAPLCTFAEPSAVSSAASVSPAIAPAEISALKQEIQAIRTAYEARLQALELRLKIAEMAVLPAANNAASASAAAPIAALSIPSASAANTTDTAASGASRSGANAFNPAISLILSGVYTNTAKDPAAYAITGFSLPTSAEIGPGKRGFSLAETELGLNASIDPWLRGATTISLHPDNAVSVEEAFVQSTALGNGFTAKAGRFFSGVGYLNDHHSHTWDFVDNPLAYQALLGTQYGDDGVQLRWLAPTELFLEFGAELGSGRGFPGGDGGGSGRNGAGMRALYTHAGGDVGDSHSWRAGVSILNAKSSEQSLTTADSQGNHIDSVFNGNTRVWMSDFVWKWAPNGNATRTNFKLQGEYLRSTKDGNTSYGGLSRQQQATQSGWYLQSIVQFAPGWRFGLRTEQLNAGKFDVDSTALPFALSSAATNYRPRKDSVMLDFSASEFSRFRLQFARDRAREGVIDNQLFLQYQMSLGAHGAHNY